MHGRTYKIYTDAHGHRFVANDSIGPVVQHISRVSGCGVTRMYAGADATALVHACGLHTQAEVIHLHEIGTPGYGPANPVDRSTHCDYNDGVAYATAPGTPVPEYGEGMDLEIPLISEFIRVAAQEHNLVTRTYPNSRGEAQHCNFRRSPVINIWKLRPLRLNSKGKRVRGITRMLCHIPDPTNHGKPYLDEPSNTITFRIERAIKRFQKYHHQHIDGVVGIQTHSQIVASYRWHQIHRSK